MRTGRPILPAAAGLLAALALLPGAAGCGPEDDRAPGFVCWSAGKLGRNYAVDCGRAWAAAGAAARGAGFRIVRERHDEFSGRLDAQTSDGLPVLVEVDRVSWEVTRVGVRVGFIGSRPESEKFMAEFEKRLGK